MYTIQNFVITSSGFKPQLAGMAPEACPVDTVLFGPEDDPGSSVGQTVAAPSPVIASAPKTPGGSGPPAGEPVTNSDGVRVNVA